MGKSHRSYVNKHNLKLNRHLQIFYESLLYNIYTSAYKWENLPEGIDARYLERSLICHGTAFIWQDDILGPVGLAANAGGNVNAYGIPHTWHCFGQGGFSQRVPNRDGVYIFNTNDRFSDLNAIMMFAERLAQTDISVDVNIRLQRFPGVIVCDEKEKLTWENLMLQYDGGSYMIFTKKDINLGESVQHIDFKVPYLADKLEYSKRDLLADAMHYIGVQVSSSNKQERLASTEIDSFIGYVEACRAMHLSPRQDGAERMNKKFGWNASVDINKDFVNMLKIADVNPFNAKKEGKALYDSSSGEEAV